MHNGATELQHLLENESSGFESRRLPKLAWLATTDSEGLPRNRTVILRDIEWQDGYPVFSIAVDRNSAKVKELLRWSRGFELCWYVVDTWTQYRLRGDEARILVGAEGKLEDDADLSTGYIRHAEADDAELATSWRNLGTGGRKSFCDIALLHEKESLDAAKEAVREMTMPDEYCVLKLKASVVEYLRLNSDLQEADVNRVARAQKGEDGVVGWRWSSS